MAKLKWNQDATRLYETGVSEVALYVKENGTYGKGVAWEGITGISESPSGAESTALWAGDVKYLNLISAEELAATVEAYTYPDEFAVCDGSAELIPGMKINQQSRCEFGLVYKTRIGNSANGVDYGYKLHIIYGALAAPSSKDYATINESPEAITFSWELSTTPVEVGDVNGKKYKPTASIEIDSTKFTGEDNHLATLEGILYGTTEDEPTLLLPNEVYSVLSTGQKPTA